MTDQEILDNAPKGATHYSQGMHYLALNSKNNWMRYDQNGVKNANWFKADDYLLAYCNKSFRSLADIKRIAELERDAFVKSNEANAATHRAIEMLLEKDDRIAELEKDIGQPK